MNYDEICREMNQAGWMSNPIGVCIKYSDGHRIEKALKSSETYHAWKAKKPVPAFPKDKHVVSAILNIPGERKMKIDLNRERGLVRNKKKGRIGFLVDVEEFVKEQ